MKTIAPVSQSPLTSASLAPTFKNTIEARWHCLASPLGIYSDCLLDSVPEPQHELELEPDAPIPDPMCMAQIMWLARRKRPRILKHCIHLAAAQCVYRVRMAKVTGLMWRARRRSTFVTRTPSARSPLALPHVLPLPPETPFQPARASSIFRFVRRP